MIRRLTAILVSLLLFVLPVCAEAPSLFDYTDDILEDGTLIYYFQEMSLKLPASWRGKVMAEQKDGGVSFYQKSSHEKYLAEGIDSGGFLFMLSACVNHSFSQLPSFKYIGFSESSAMNYYLQLPTDYPAYNEKDIRAEYDEMFRQIDFVVENASFYSTGTSEQNLQTIKCPQQGFSTKADKSYEWDYKADTGISIYTENKGSIPYVIVYQGEDLIVEAFEYINEQYTPHMKQKYGSDLVSYESKADYEIGGKKLPAGLYTYKLQGYSINMIRIYDSTGKRTVAYTAKFIQGKGDATLKALDTAVRYFEADSKEAESSKTDSQKMDSNKVNSKEADTQKADSKEVNPK